VARARARRRARTKARTRTPLTQELILLAVRGMVLFPGVVIPVTVGRPRSVAAIQAGIKAGRPIGVIMQQKPDVADPGAGDLHRVGTLAQILRVVNAPDGTHHVIIQGKQRFELIEVLGREPHLSGRVKLVPEEAEGGATPAREARFHSLKQAALEALALLPQKPEELESAVGNASSPAALADMAATFLDLPAAEKQELLETFDLDQRLEKIAKKLEHVREVLSLSREIRNRTKGSLDKAQREYYLREQLRTIQKELGEELTGDAKDLQEKLDAAGLSPEAKKEAARELARLERIPEASAEHALVRNYLEWLVELPWAKKSDDELDLARAQAILDADHWGLDKVKRRIVEFLAVRKLKGTAASAKGPILCLVGPPGTGKTSLGQSVAKALGRKFARLSLGGVHDEAEIRGHRRTYVGALPGNVVQALRRVGTNNPVLMLDELDKLSASFQGDPSSALLEVLDPEQNHAFRDNYLGVPFDLSRVLFIGTANVLDSIPGPLRDRLEVLELSGYTEEEKLEIARRYLVARQLEANGLTAEQVRVENEALVEIVRRYTREAGVRNLERELGSLLRHAATRIAKGEAQSLVIGAADVPAILGQPRHENELAARTSVPGVATGLAWTPVGGELLFIEASRMPGKGEFILTGQLGDVMKESARAALSLLRSGGSGLAFEPKLLEGHDLHVHVPSGGIPKDGPSAGVAVAMALASLFSGRCVRSDVAMTGEISLRGLVLPVGGVKEKVLAAYRAGIKTVLLPARNRKDFDDVPQAVRERLRFVWLEHVREALPECLEPPLAAAAEQRPADEDAPGLAAAAG
jgi:ATP-dependent Lon protease